MTTPEGPAHGNPADRPAWGTPPAGGWGEKPADGAETRSWSEEGVPRTDADGATTRVTQPRPEPDGSVTRLEQPGTWGPPNGPNPGAWGGPQAGAPQIPAPAQWGPNPQAPAWAQQPPPGGGWGPQQPYPGGPPHGAPPQWGPPGYPPLPGPPSRRPRRSRTPFVIGGVVLAVLAVVAFLVFVVPGFAYSTVFDRAQLQAGVQRVLTDDYQYTDVGEVVCGDPAGPPITVRVGAMFTCTTTIGGAPATVPVTVTTDEGGYDVSRPT